MHEKLAEILQKPDEDLFRQGACHVFAKALLDKFSPQHLEGFPWRLCATDRFAVDVTKATHVLLEKNGDVVDFRGRQKFEDYASRWRSEFIKSSSLPNWIDPCLELSAFNYDDLLKRSRSDLGWATNSFGHHTDEEFVAESEKRALQFIEQNMGKFEFLRGH